MAASCFDEKRKKRTRAVVGQEGASPLASRLNLAASATPEASGRSVERSRASFSSCSSPSSAGAPPSTARTVALPHLPAPSLAHTHEPPSSEGGPAPWRFDAHGAEESPPTLTVPSRSAVPPEGAPPERLRLRVPGAAAPPTELRSSTLGLPALCRAKASAASSAVENQPRLGRLPLKRTRTVYMSCPRLRDRVLSSETLA
mmetsp:Transcript_1955/g.6373  ORF Transcript_1955/g.6373 Transcript_1955/m.6373 type:complete len:201 (+) Transcript_1955:178-780(+)